MYKSIRQHKGSIKVNASYDGESIETKVERIVHQKEPINDGAPLIYTDRKEGVKPEYDIRTDRFEIAIDAMDAVSRTDVAKRNTAPKVDVIQEGDGKAEPTQATE